MVTNFRTIEIGARARECRVAAKLSINHVAEELHVSKQTVSAWEKGRRRIEGERVADLALMYGVSCDYILLGTHMVPQDLRDLFSRLGRQDQASPQADQP